MAYYVVTTAQIVHTVHLIEIPDDVPGDPQDAALDKFESEVADETIGDRWGDNDYPLDISEAFSTRDAALQSDLCQVDVALIGDDDKEVMLKCPRCQNEWSQIMSVDDYAGLCPHCEEPGEVTLSNEKDNN